MSNESVNVDTCVIGSGIIGMASALEMTKRGHTVALLDGMAPGGAPASTAAGAMLCLTSEASPNESSAVSKVGIELRIEARRRYDEWVREVCDDHPSIIRNGLFVITGDALGSSATREFEFAQQLNTRYGLKQEEVPFSRVFENEDHPLTNKKDGLRAFLFSDEGSIDLPQLLTELQRAVNKTCIRKDGEIRTFSDRGGHIEIMTDTVKINSKHIVLAAGVGIDSLRKRHPILRDIGIPQMLGARGVSAIIQSPGLDLRRAVRVPNEEFACGAHVVPRGQSIYLGATNRLQLGNFERVSEFASVSETTSLLRGLSKAFPQRLGQARVESFRLGIRPFIADKLPVVGRTEDERIVLATGTYRNGILLAPVIAARVAAAIESTHGSQQDQQLSPLRRPLPISVSTMKSAVRESIERYLENSSSDEADYNLYSALLDNIDDIEKQERELATLYRLWRQAPIAENVPNLAIAYSGLAKV